MSSLKLPQIHSTSPTLAETMRVCLLRAGLSRATGSSGFVLGNPKAWLGTAYHEVLEKIVEVDLGQETLDAAVERLWNQAIATQQQRANGHALDRRFGSPAAWPG
ncbi:MAG TPA: PD-(D/E)XK nuclease family protein [Candidatus Krumholzibacteria bacterium]